VAGGERELGKSAVSHREAALTVGGYVVPKHRRSESPWPASAGSPMNRAELAPYAVGYGQAGPTPVHGTVVPGGNGYPESRDDYGVEPSRAAATDSQIWQDWQDQGWGPPPALHPDHPSAPVARIWLPDDHPSGPMPAPGAPLGPGIADASSRWSAPSHDRLDWAPVAPDSDGSGIRGPAARPSHGPWRDRQSGRRVPERQPGPPRHEPAAYQRQPGLPRREVAGYQRQPGPRRREVTDHQRPAGPGWPEATAYHHETGPFGPGPGTGRFQNGRSPNGESVLVAEQVLEAAEREAAAIVRQATDHATAIREAAEREAAELRARVDSTYAELSRVAGFLAESLATAPAPVTAPALPGSRPALPGTKQAPPITRPKPARPGTARPAHPAPRPARPTIRPTRPASKPAGRQAKVARKFMAAFVVVSLIGAASGAAELKLHGLPFFIFRANGAGATETGPEEPASPPKAGQPFDPGAKQKPTAHPTPGAHSKPTTAKQ
jgi:hypothetical protein